jgi:hypothetical protein
MIIVYQQLIYFHLRFEPLINYYSIVDIDLLSLLQSNMHRFFNPFLELIYDPSMFFYVFPALSPMDPNTKLRLTLQIKARTLPKKLRMDPILSMFFPANLINTYKHL